MSRHETTKACALILSCCSNSISTVQERNETGGNMIREDQKYFEGLALLQPQLVKFLRGSEHISSSCSKSRLIRPRTPCTFMNFFSSFLLNSSSTKTTRSSGFRFDFNFNALLIFIVERLWVQHIHSQRLVISLVQFPLLKESTERMRQVRKKQTATVADSYYSP